MFTILTKTEGSYYGLPPIYNQFVERLLDETLGRDKFVRKKESTFLVSRRNRLDNYHMGLHRKLQNDGEVVVVSLQRDEMCGCLRSAQGRLQQPEAVC